MTTQVKLIDLSRSYTAAEFEALPDDGNRYELWSGRLRQMPPPGDEHGLIVHNLNFYIRFFDPEKKLGEVWTNAGFRLDADNTLEPDLLYVVAARRPPRSKQALQVIPDLVVEVWSPSQINNQGIDDDSMTKIRKYQEVGVKIIWSINPDKQTVTVYYGDSSRQVRYVDLNGELDGEEIIPNFKLAVRQLFE